MTITLVPSLAGLPAHEMATVGGSALLANRIVYRNSGTLSYAKADAVSTSLNIVGVMAYGASASQPAAIQRFGFARITADSSCSPSLDGNAYLSSEAGGKVASTLTGNMYPRLIGRFTEASVAADGTVGVLLSIDELRDLNNEWLIDDWTPTVDTQSRDVSVTRAFWDTLIFVGEDLIKTGAYQLQLRIDGAPPSGYRWAVQYSGHSAAADVILLQGNNVHVPFRAVITFSSVFTLAQGSGVDYTTGSHHVVACSSVPATSIGIQGGDTNAFEANVSNLKLYGKAAR